MEVYFINKYINIYKNKKYICILKLGEKCYLLGDCFIRFFLKWVLVCYNRTSEVSCHSVASRILMLNKLKLFFLENLSLDLTHIQSLNLFVRCCKDRGRSQHFKVTWEVLYSSDYISHSKSAVCIFLATSEYRFIM